MTKIPLKPANEQFTDQQWQAIFDGGDNLLISASAGSGKTTVLVRRVIEKLKNGVNVDELLIVTFTEAAAREMKERIQVALQKAVNQESDEARRNHFTKQLLLLPSANISTINAFYLSIIRRFYFLIDLDPVFRMLTDETERLMLKEEVWQALLEEKYASQEEAFYRLVENFSNDRSDEGLTDLVMSLYTFALANPDPITWLKGLKESYRLTDGLASSSLYQTQLKPLIVDQVRLACGKYLHGVHLAEFDPIFKKTHALMNDELQQAQRLLVAVEADDLETASAQMEALNFQRFSGPTKAEYKALKEEIKSLRDAGKDYLATLQTEFFPYPLKQMVELMEQSYPLVDQLAQLTIEFLERYQALKVAKGLLEFNDTEHFALQILQGDGSGSEASQYYRQKFKEVLVDEYQDVNRLQEAILFWTRQVEGAHSGNLFMVGDVKQSIYAFRLADPTLFIEKYLAFGDERDGRRIILAENFRSRKEVLAFTNLIFRQLMDERVGQIPYDQAAELIPGFPLFPESDQFHPELLIYETEAEENLDLVDSKTEGELHMVGLKIRQLIDAQFQIYDKKLKVNRALEYNDIVLLTPTKKNNLDILDALKKYAIPLEVNDAQNYFQATEIQTMISLLQIIDNPYNDIPLVSTLRSPLVGLTEEDLATIRIVDKENDFYQALLSYRIEGEDEQLKQTIASFLAQLTNWRDFAKTSSISALLWEIYHETAYLDYVLGLSVGQQRHANLIALVDRAQAYEQSSFRGLYQFIRFIEKMQEKDKDLAEPLATPVENAVRVMTIHASKGLEFPVVFLLDMSKNFNDQDFRKNYIFEEQLGAGIEYLDQAKRVKFKTIPFQAIKEIRRKKAFSEEMRKLYVALTRAEQKLFLVGSYKSKEQALKKWQEALTEEEVVLNPILRLKKENILFNWVGMSLMRHPKMETEFAKASQRTLTLDSSADFSLEWWHDEKIKLANEQLNVNQAANLEEAKSIKENLTPLKERLDFVYPHQKAMLTTSYQSVSEIKRIFDDPDNQDAAQIIWQSEHEKAQIQRYRYANDRLAVPKFMEEITIDAAAIGSATHTVMQTLPLAEVTFDSINNWVTYLVSQQVLEAAIAQKIKLQNILWFFETKLGQQILAHPTKVKREQPFAMLKSAQAIFAEYDQVDDELLIHGIIDGYLNTEDGIVLYDFKTDYVTQENRHSVIQRYQGQLRLYKEALEEASGQKVIASYLVLLNKQELVSLEIS
ncbi:MAG: helicase-exonuclease AddAB subunit AddA [Enterococcus sp.]